MFKNAIIYRIAPSFNGAVLEGFFEAQQFAPIGAAQEKSIGWVPPRGEDNGALVEHVAGAAIMKLMVETKKVPTDIIDRRLKEQCANIEQMTGRRPGKKERRELKDEIKLTLLPTTHSKRASTLVWINLRSRLLVIDASSQARADEVLTMLVRSIDGISMQTINTQQTPARAMTLWLNPHEELCNFSIDRECELVATDESKAKVRYAKHPLDIPEIQAHLYSGKVPTKLAMTWDDQVSFVLTDTMVLKRIAVLDVVFEEHSNKGMDGFDADVTIFTGAMNTLIPDLISAMGGEVSST